MRAIFRPYRSLAATAALVAVAGSLYSACPSPQPPGEVSFGGNGKLTRGGAAADYHVDSSSELLIAVHNDFSNFGCGFFHSHVVKAEAALLEFNLDDGNLAGSSIKATVASAGLNPDAPELRARFDDMKDAILSDGDRNSIRASVLDQVEGAEHPLLTFDATNLSTADGEGTAQITANVAGQESTFTLNYTARTEGDNVIVEGTGILEGNPHGIPHGFAADCVIPQLDIVMKLVFAPGLDANVSLPDGPEEYVQQNFPPADDSCDDVAGFDKVREVLGPKCMGCHGDNLILGATVPLIDFADYRVDSSSNRGKGLYETVKEFIELPESETRHMPPVESGNANALTQDEIDLIVGWVDRGGKETTCDFVPSVVEHVREENCGDINYESAPGFTNDVSGPREFLENTCIFCHDGSLYGDQVSTFTSYAEGTGDALHSFYAESNLNLFEASLQRMKDHSMPIGFEVEQDDIDAFQAWIEAGYPEAACE